MMAVQIACYGTSDSFRVEWAADSIWNKWQPWYGMYKPFSGQKYHCYFQLGSISFAGCTENYQFKEAAENISSS
jgi:hypothetical protein